MILMWIDAFRGPLEGGEPWKLRLFWALKWQRVKRVPFWLKKVHKKALAYRLDAISQDTKKFWFPGPNPLPLALVMDAARIKSITHGPVQIIGA